MLFADLIRNAFSNLRRRKLRSSLTIFAVIIGASLVALLVSIGIGMQSFLNAQVQAILPPRVVLVASNQNVFQFGLGGLNFGNPQEVSGNESPFSLEPLTLKQIDDIQALPNVERTDPYIILLPNDTISLEGQDQKFQATIRPRPEYQMKLNELVAGTYFSDGSTGKCIITDQFIDVFGLPSAEAVIGRTAIVEVTQAASLIGLPGETRAFPFEIIGVTQKTINSDLVAVSLEDGKAIARFWANRPNLYTDEIPPAIVQVEVNSSQNADLVAREAESLGLGAITSSDVLGIIGSIFGIMQAVLAAFGLIALGVASLSIVNTLVMSVHERTREIGVMKAVGASKRSIRSLLTVEGAAIGLIGGVIGVGIAYLLGAVINSVSHRTFLSDFQSFNISVIPWWLALGVVALATVIALVAALYPANRAARLDPIEALRYE